MGGWLTKVNGLEKHRSHLQVPNVQCCESAHLQGQLSLVSINASINQLCINFKVVGSVRGNFIGVNWSNWAVQVWCHSSLWCLASKMGVQCAIHQIWQDSRSKYGQYAQVLLFKKPHKVLRQSSLI